MYISLKNLNKSYGNTPVLHDINLDIHQGEIVSILGSSGCGKTTLAKCLLGLESFDGEIMINRESLHDYLKKNRIGYVPQRYANFEHLSVLENLKIVFEIITEKDLEKINHFLKVFGLYNYKNNYPKDLSGGMKQRLAIARALLVPTDIIIFDEPLSALDIETRQKIQELLLSVWEQDKKTFIFITHDIEEAIYFSKKIIVMESNPGKIKTTLEIPYRYPRIPNIRYEKDFQDLRKTLSLMIRSESIKGLLARNIHHESITIGLYMWAGNAPWYYAEDKGLFDTTIPPVEIISFSDTHQKDLYFDDNLVNILHTTKSNLPILYKKYPDMVVLTQTDISYGADGIITTLPVTNITDLKNTSVGVETREVGLEFLKYVLEKNNMSMHDINIINAKNEDLGTLLLSGKVDSIVSWEPYLSKILEISGGNIIADTTQYPAPLDNILVCKKDFYENHKTTIDTVLEIFKKSVYEYENNPQIFIQKTAPMVGLTEKELRETLSKVKFTK